MTFAELQEMLAEQFSCEVDEVQEDTVLTDDLGADELDLTELAWQVSENTGLSLSEEQLQGFETVGELWQFIRDNAEPQSIADEM